jgi:serine/threonine protein kinase
LFIDDVGHLLIGCFEESRFAGTELTRQVGSPHYMAPEMYEEGCYSDKVDVFSFGLILYEMLTRKPVFAKELRPQQVMRRVLSSSRALIPDTIPAPISQLIEDCWHDDPAVRPSFERIFKRLAAVTFLVVPGADVCEVRKRVNTIHGFTPRCCLCPWCRGRYVTSQPGFPCIVCPGCKRELCPWCGEKVTDHGVGHLEVCTPPPEVEVDRPVAASSSRISIVLQLFAGDRTFVIQEPNNIDVKRFRHVCAQKSQCSIDDFLLFAQAKVLLEDGKKLWEYGIEPGTPIQMAYCYRG